MRSLGDSALVQGAETSLSSPRGRPSLGPELLAPDPQHGTATSSTLGTRHLLGATPAPHRSPFFGLQRPPPGSSQAGQFR